MKRYDWGHLNRQQVGTFAEYFVKMEFTMYGFQVYTAEVDDRGIDFVVRYENNPFIEIQVKSVRDAKYIFLCKNNFTLKDDLYLALGILKQEVAPDLFLIPSLTWEKIAERESKTFVDRDYEGLKSKPEWGINLSKKNMSELSEFQFPQMIKRLTK
ncbi:MAG: DUF4365 domain-containing protein [Desulfurivibrio sp.]|nr:DUF4365 domain-containing protein [Desulfurivibrio sp.]MBU4118882.1 DUF4365 domain-containing protein [Pseudomonadota bacterium]